jgi:hypothetical protein
MQRGQRLFSLVHCTRDLAPYNPNGQDGRINSWLWHGRRGAEKSAPRRRLSCCIEVPLSAVG